MRNRFFARSFAILIALFIMTLGSLSAHAASATVTFSTADNAYMSDTTGDATPDLLVKSVTAGQTASISFSAVPPQGASGIMAQLQAYSAGIDAWAGLDGETRLCISAPAGHVFDLSGFKYATGNLVSNIYIGTETNDGYYATVANQFAGESTLVAVDASGYGITGVNKVYLSASEDIVLFQDIVISNIKIKLSTPGSLAWDGTVPGKAVWDPVVNASSYTVQLYKDGVIYGTATSTSANYYDFTGVIATTGSGSYTYTVTPIGDGTTYADSDQSAASPAYSYTPFVAVTGISGVPTSATAGDNLTLSGTVAPAEATNKTITWSVVSAGTTGASISGNTLSTTAAGTATIRATITNGLSASSDYTQDFTITVNAAFVPVTDITGLPTSAIAGTSLTLSGTVEPASATNKTITWSVLDQGFTGATLSGNTLSIPSPGTILLEATVVNGLTASTHYHKYIYISVFSPVPVTGITGVPTSATAGTPLTLSGTVEPANATNKTITWSVASAGTTGASISGNILSTTAAGTATIRATIANGLAASSDYTEDFTVTVNPAFVPVTSITGLPTSATAGETLTLSGTVAPADATNKTITWSVIGVSTTGATISGNTLSTTGEGVALIRATVVNGFTASSDYTRDFMITVNPAFVPVTGISGVPTSATAGSPLTLSGTVEPADATNKTITWNVASAGTTGASISGDTLSTTAAGTATIRATITNGLAASSDYTQDFTVTVNAAFVPVTGISGVPTSATAGSPLTLSGTVEPDEATNKTITWSVASAGTTGASVSGNTLSTTAAGTATIRATITNGLTASSDYTEDFTVTVNPAFVRVTDITDVPTSATAGTPLTLSGTVEPADATNKTITWSVASAGTTGASISGNILSTTAAGTATIRATITNGLTASSDYTQDFTVTVNPAFVPVTGITGVPTSATAGTPLTLSGTVEPANATNKTITWSVVGVAPTGPSISGNTLSTTTAGIVIVRATIANGAGPSSNYNEDFSITVNPAFVPVTGITGVPTSATAGTPLPLSGTVEPANATNKTITWSVASAGTTGASVSGNTLSTTGAGTATIRATITNGLTASSDYTQDLTVTVNPAMSEDTLTEAVGSTTISAQGVFAPGAALVVTVLPSGEDDREELETLMGDKQILGAYEARITPAGAYTPPLTLTFEVGEEHNGSTVYVLHKLGSGGTEQFTPTVTNGAVSIIVNELSPFLLAKDLSLTITSQPQDVRAVAGQTVSFSVWATGEAPLTYQWQRKISSGSSEKRQSKTPSSWKRIDGATAPDYTIARIDLSQNGSQYRVIVTDGLDNSIASSAATLTVTKASSPDTGDHAQPALYALLAALFAAALVLLLKKRRAS